MIIVGDIHGNFKTFMALLDKIPQEEKDKGIVVSGDLIDRGPRSRQVVQYCIDNDILVTIGNHEEMMIYSGGQSRWSMPWVQNGGDKTLRSYGTKVYVNKEGIYELIDTEEKEKDTQNHIYVRDVTAIEEHLEWMEKLPVYLEFPDIKNDDGRYLVVSHSHIANAWRGIKKYGMNYKRRETILWDRPYKLKNIPDIYNVIGHTPIQNGPKIKKSYANIDTGCYYNKEPGHNILTALQFPEMIIYQQENIDR